MTSSTSLFSWIISLDKALERIEFRFIKKKRESLDDVIKYEGIANRNDSVISIYNMSDLDRIAYYEKYILKLKKEDELKKALTDKDDEKNKKKKS